MDEKRENPAECSSGFTEPSVSDVAKVHVLSRPRERRRAYTKSKKGETRDVALARINCDFAKPRARFSNRETHFTLCSLKEKK